MAAVVLLLFFGLLWPEKAKWLKWLTRTVGVGGTPVGRGGDLIGDADPRRLQAAAHRVRAPAPVVGRREAEEVAAEAVARAYRALPTFRGDGPIEAWLCIGQK